LSPLPLKKENPSASLKALKPINQQKGLVMPNSTKQLATFPISGWELQVVMDCKAILFQPHYLATEDDNPDTPHKGQTFVLSTKIARELAQKLVELSAQLEIDDDPTPGHLTM
jgi:hypothetical protein